MEYWSRKQDSDDMEKYWYLLNRSLGTLWERSDFATVVNKSYKDKVLNTVWYPLSLLLSPASDLKKIIKKDFVQKGQQIGGGDYIPAANEEIVNLGQTTTKEQFLELMGKLNPLPVEKPPEK